MHQSLTFSDPNKPLLAEAIHVTNIQTPEIYASCPAPTRKRRRPPYSYTALIAQAILVSEHKQLTLREIYDSINRMYPQICQGPDIGWQNTIRHNLSLNNCFKRIPRQQLPSSLSSKLRGKGSYWMVDVTLMDVNTRKRLEEAVSTMSNTADNNTSNINISKDSRSPRAYKRAKSMLAPKPHRGSNADSVRCVSPLVQSPSPYFQSTLNPPISSAPKHAVKQRRLNPTHELEGFGALPTPVVSTPHPSAVPRNRFYGRPSSCHIDGQISFDTRPWVSPANSSPMYFADRHMTAMPLPVSPYLFGSTISCSRSTVRANHAEPLIDVPGSSLNPSTASSSIVGSRQNSPFSLSPAPSLDSDDCPNPSKHNINHLLN
ncbi:hypothetical protein IWW50_005072 [Coemansia erecta]|nr:hypothetical protein GGF43_000809 [Coemansia sp. RSA 2618]KAJ2820392.1 hypothetical protein IWW50_005072 [Coemansia erecta]